MNRPGFRKVVMMAAGSLAALLSVVPVAWGQAPGDTIPPSRDWVLQPPLPCVEDDVVLYVRGFFSTRCDSFIGAGRTADRLVVVRSLYREGFFCFAAPVPCAIPIGFGRLPAGSQGITVRQQRMLLRLDGTLDSTTVDEQVTFEVTPTCVPPMPIPAEQLPFVRQVGTSPERPCPEQSTSLELGGIFPDGCGRLVSAGTDNGRLHVVLAPYPDVPVGCPEILKPWHASLGLGFLQTGFHQVHVDMTVRGNRLVWPPILDQRYVGSFRFSVTTPCDTLPGGLLPFVDFVRVLPAHGDATRPICAGDSIRVAIGGTFPSDCYWLRRVELLYTRAGPQPQPPVVRLVVDDGSCLGRPCSPGPLPWRTDVKMGPLPSGAYSLVVQLDEATGCTDSIPPDRSHSALVPFRVAPAESCGIQPFVCLTGKWESSAGDPAPCHAVLSPQSPASVTLGVTSGVALSGFQGTLRFLEPGLRITALETAGTAVGMRLSWTSTGDGARFVMFADQDAPIPAKTFSPVLRATIGAAPIRGPGVMWPPVFHLAAEDLLGSDVDARAVPDCSVLYGAPPLPVLARICVERPCDFNADGAADVRDLVLMVRCVTGTGACPPDAPTRFDCDGDGQLAVADVLCCAVHVLRGPLCPDCPADTTRLARGQVELGVPVPTDRGVRVSVRLTDPDELGAARIALRFPTDRYRLAGVELLHGTQWLELHETSESGITLGLIRLQPKIDLAVGPPLDAVLVLELQPGHAPGGEVRLESGDFSANDGVRLELEMGETARALGSALSLALSPARPNPFTGETRFVVTLDGDAQLDVGVYDLAGRLVARLYRGAKGPGTHAFTWDGRTAGGEVAGEGVYFYRVTGAGHSASGKVALLRVR